jgi:hypothetical protein
VQIHTKLKAFIFKLSIQGVDSVEMKKKEAFQFNLFAAYII